MYIFYIYVRRQFDTIIGHAIYNMANFHAIYHKMKITLLLSGLTISKGFVPKTRLANHEMISINTDLSFLIVYHVYPRHVEYQRKENYYYKTLKNLIKVTRKKEEILIQRLLI